ncbi:Sporulation and spore germination [Caloramator mitchellensis]|uniref:Sporulation and spore germination n=1 Tax=Caloramator mitchellensis TaxID=908809 RepID=A0A0R3JUC2_CALMK|nr:Sporulation and spore germination [Caloramator mitchellensis]
MKKLFIVIMVFLLLISCVKNIPTPNQNNTPNTTQKKYTLKDYYPFISDRRMKYQGIGNEYAEKDVYVDFINDNRIQLRVLNPGTILAQVLEIKDGELRLIKSQEEFYYRDYLIDSQNSSPEILLKEPLEKGTAWNTPEGKRYISEVNKKISTPSGEYEALEVTTEGKDYKTYDYYVLNIGLVKTVFESGENKIETNLEKIETGVPVIHSLRVYYPDFLNERIIFKEEKISYKTNETFKDKLETLLKNTPDDKLSKILGSNSKINNVYLNVEENKVYIDLSKEFISDMNAGSSLESMILQSLVNTLGSYYSVEKVFISLDGKPYESGHIAIKEGEFFKVDYKNTVEIK